MDSRFDINVACLQGGRLQVRIYDCVQMRHVLYLQFLCRHSAGRPVLRYYCAVTKWSECIIYPAEWRHPQWTQMSSILYIPDHVFQWSWFVHMFGVVITSPPLSGVGHRLSSISSLQVSWHVLNNNYSSGNCLILGWFYKADNYYLNEFYEETLINAPHAAI